MTTVRYQAEPDFQTVGAKTFHPETPQDVRRLLLYDLCIYDTLYWGRFTVLRLPFHRYRVTNQATGRSERVGGKSAKHGMYAVLNKLGVEI